MKETKDHLGMLDLMIRPGFCVKENVIIKTNAAADALLIQPGTDVRTLLLTGQEEYAAFEHGCLYLKLSLTSQGCGASVTKSGEYDVFLLDQEADDAELRCLSLAARELREPLTSIMISADRLQSSADAEHAARLNRGLHQMLRIIGNMSDAGRSASGSRQETRDLSALFAEIFEKAQALVSQTQITLSYQGLSEPVLALADAEQLERAVLNMLSNAIKFTPRGGQIQAQLSHTGKSLRLSIQDSGSGIGENVLRSVFSRYLRQPGIEDSRHGLGLGMVLIRAAAASHGGTVLIDCPSGQGTRITMTLSLRQNPASQLRSPVMHVDYAGEQDHGLIELSECLPVQVYRKEK